MLDHLDPKLAAVHADGLRNAIVLEVFDARRGDCLVCLPEVFDEK